MNLLKIVGEPGKVLLNRPLFEQLYIQHHTSQGYVTIGATPNSFLLKSNVFKANPVLAILVEMDGR